MQHSSKAGPLDAKKPKWSVKSKIQAKPRVIKLQMPKEWSTEPCTAYRLCSSGAAPLGSPIGSSHPVPNDVELTSSLSSVKETDVKHQKPQTPQRPLESPQSASQNQTPPSAALRQSAPATLAQWMPNLGHSFTAIVSKPSEGDDLLSLKDNTQESLVGNEGLR